MRKMKYLLIFLLSIPQIAAAEYFTFNLGTENAGFRLFCGIDGNAENRQLVAQFSGALPPGIEADLSLFPEGISYCDFRDFNPAEPSAVIWPALIIERSGDAVAVNLGTAPEPPELLTFTDNFEHDRNPFQDGIEWLIFNGQGTGGGGQSIGGNYSDGSGSFADKAVYRSGDFKPSQFARITVGRTGNNGNKRLGILLRVSDSSALLVRYLANNATYEAYFWNNGPRTQLPGVYVPPFPLSAGDQIEARIEGSTLTLYEVRDSIFTPLFTWDASAGPSEGSPGLYIVEPASGWAIGSIVGGEL